MTVLLDHKENVIFDEAKFITASSESHSFSVDELYKLANGWTYPPLKATPPTTPKKTVAEMLAEIDAKRAQAKADKEAEYKRWITASSLAAPKPWEMPSLLLTPRRRYERSAPQRVKDSVILGKAIEAIEKYGWTQGTMGSKKRGFCTVGAIYFACNELDTASWEVEKYVHQRAREKYGVSAMGYNDRTGWLRGTKRRHVLKFLGECKKELEAQNR